MKRHTPSLVYRGVAVVTLVLIGCDGAPSPAPTGAASTTSIVPTPSASAVPSPTNPAPSVTASASASATAAPARADACAALASWSPWGGAQPKSCKLLVPPDPGALPPLAWTVCATELGIAGCKELRGREPRVDVARATAATRIPCNGTGGGGYVEVAELDGKVIAAFGATGVDLGECSLSLLDHREGHWLVGARGEPLSEGKAGTVPSRAVESIVVGGAVPGNVAALWSARDEARSLHLGFADAQGYAFSVGDLQAEQWRGGRWQGSATALLSPLETPGVAFGNGALFVAADKRGLLVVGPEGEKESLLPGAVKVSGVAADGKDIVFRAVRERRCRLFASPLVKRRADFAPRSIAEGCDEPVIVGCGRALARSKDRFTLIRLSDGAKATLAAPSNRLGDPTALSCTEAFFAGSWHLMRIPLASFGTPAPPPSAPVAADPADLFDTHADAGAPGDAGAEAASDAGAAADAGPPLTDAQKRP